MTGHRHLLVIGGQRCGTTWFQQVLASHPDVRLPRVVRPEPKFFLTDDDHDRYDALFDRVDGVLVDKSTTYHERADAAANAHRCVPDATVVAVLRDPVERAYSNWRFSVANGLETLAFADSLTAQAQARTVEGLSTSPFASLHRGLFADLLAPWAAAFGERLVVVQYERMIGAGGAAYVRELLADSGLPTPAGWPELPPAVNAAPEGVMDDDSRRLLAEYYAAPNRRTEALGIDLSLWSAP